MHYRVPHRAQRRRMSCWWASIRMLTAYYGVERTEPDHWNPRFEAPSSPVPSREYADCGPQAPSGSAHLAMESYYATTWSAVPPNRWLELGIPARIYALEVLKDLMRGRLADASHGFAGPQDWTAERFEAYLRRVGPVLVTRAVPGFYGGGTIGFHRSSRPACRMAWCSIAIRTATCLDGEASPWMRSGASSRGSLSCGGCAPHRRRAASTNATWTCDHGSAAGIVIHGSSALDFS